MMSLIAISGKLSRISSARLSNGSPIADDHFFGSTSTESLTRFGSRYAIWKPASSDRLTLPLVNGTRQFGRSVCDASAYRKMPVQV